VIGLLKKGFILGALVVVVGVAAMNVRPLYRAWMVNRHTPAPPTKEIDTAYRLVWEPAPSTTATEYRIYIGSKSGAYDFGEPSAVVPGDVTEWVLSELSSGRYFAVVTAVSESQESPPTQEIQFIVR
jgi:hypothetical protein